MHFLVSKFHIFASTRGTCAYNLAILLNHDHTVNSRDNQVGYNELSGHNEVFFFGPHVLLMQITSVITKPR